MIGKDVIIHDLICPKLFLVGLGNKGRQFSLNLVAAERPTRFSRSLLFTELLPALSFLGKPLKHVLRIPQEKARCALQRLGLGKLLLCPIWFDL